MGSFTIDGRQQTGQIKVGEGTTLDFESSSKTTYEVEVTARDPFGLRATSTMVTIIGHEHERAAGT